MALAIVGFVPLALASGSLGCKAAGAEQEGDMAANRDGIAHPVPATSAGFVPARWRPAEQRRYRLAFHSVLTPQGVAPQGASDQGDQIVMSWTGDLVFTALTVDDDRTQLAAKFIGHAETNQDAKATAELDLGLVEPWFPVVAHDGRVLEVGFTPPMPTAVASAWKAILGDIQFVGSAVASPSWTVEEQDPIGRYRASYAPAGEPATWNKARSGYLTLHPQSAIAQVAYDVEHHTTVFRFDPVGRLAAVDANERVLTRSAPPIPSFVAETRISLKLAQTTSAAPAVLSALRGTGAQAHFAALASGPDARMRRDELDRGAIANVSVPELLADLDGGVPRDQAGRERRARVRKLLGAVLRQVAGHTAAIERRARTPRGDRDELFEILRDAGTPEAQAALVRLIELASLTVHDRASAIQSLGMVRQPTPGTVAHLEALIDSADLGAQARFSLASAVARLRASDPSLAAKTTGFLLDRLAQARTSSDTLMYVQALGNTGDAGVLDELGRRSHSPAPEIRSAALWSLRSIESPRAEDLLVGLVATGDEPDRVAIMRTLAFRPLTPRSETLLADHLRDDPSPRVREQVLRVTQAALRRSQPLRDAFDWCKRNDAAAALRDTAARALRALPSAPPGLP
jgi:hypothetical protein